MILDVAPATHEASNPPAIRSEASTSRFGNSDAARMVSGATVAATAGDGANVTAQSSNRLTHTEIRDRESRTGVDRSRSSSREQAMFIWVESQGGHVLRRL